MGRMGVWAYGRMGVWAYGRMGDLGAKRLKSARRPYIAWSCPASPHADTPTRPHAHPLFLATEAATRDYSALDAYSGRTHASAAVRSRNSQVLVCAL
jgi:hypothetical protein